jgi:ankyrin repeat protein
MRGLNKSNISGAISMAIVALATVWFAQTAVASGTLASSARMDDLDEARQFIDAGADINLPEPDGTTPLLWAVYNMSHDLVKLLLEAGANPNIPNKLDITPLLQASRNGDAGIIAALLDSGASMNQQGFMTEPYLMAAARSGNVDAVKLLLDAGANPNATEPFEDQTALMWAAAEGHLDMVIALLDVGANPDMRARVNSLTERKNADFPSGGFAALHWAARNGDEAMMSLLIDRGADINIRNGDDSTPMMLAIVNDRFDTAAQLLKMGADANDGSLFYITEMRDATTDWRAHDGTIYRWDHHNALSAIDLTRMLLDAGADPNKPMQMQMHNTSMCCDIKVDSTPFYRAAKAADLAGMELMLAHGADPNWKPASETRPVGIDGEEEVVSRSALMMAITGGKGVGVSGGPNDLRNGPPDFREEGVRDPVGAVKLLLAAGANVNVPGPDATTALHVAVNALQPDIVRDLVAHGAAMDAKNNKDKTPLEAAEDMSPPTPRPGFYFEPPPAQPVEIVAILKDLAGK